MCSPSAIDTECSNNSCVVPIRYWLRPKPNLITYYPHDNPVRSVNHAQSPRCFKTRNSLERSQMNAQPLSRTLCGDSSIVFDQHLQKEFVVDVYVRSERDVVTP